MAETKQKAPAAQEQRAPQRRPDQFWSKYSKPLSIGLLLVVLAVGGYFIYRSQVTIPNNRKAEEAVFKAEEYFRLDSLDKALNGDGASLGLLRVISRYSGSDAANRARLMAGSIYLRKGDFKNALKHLEDFDTDVPQVKARAIALMADTYAEMGASTNNNANKEKAADLYKQAAATFEEDHANAGEYLFRAGYLYESMGKNKEAIDAYKQIKQKHPGSDRAYQIDKYLARLGAVAE
ncbi:MAG TPA: tetratricopeptide repeat protein [Chitinophagaceae bacterium]|nr:tetratricopeptide repeat protein [Chitinophagaceae bacterium]